jgi:glucose-6-phosphate 1-dehydrogenase
MLVIFGGGGDLSWRKIVPALYNLFLDGWLDDRFAVVGLDQKPMTDAEYRQRLREGVDRFSRRGRADGAKWNAFAQHLTYAQGDFRDRTTFLRLADRLSAPHPAWQRGASRILYLATPPSMIAPIAQHAACAGLARDPSVRLVVEKPFGRDLDSARALNATLAGAFAEPQIYRIDHYLGKETVQNLLAFRFANALFEPIWDRRYIEHVQISVAEDVGVEHRGRYYERAGALRDMVQNHLLQVLCLIAMEPPVAFTADELRNKTVDVLHAIRAISADEVDGIAVRGQYGPGRVDGVDVPGYRAEPGVAPDSVVETFVVVKLLVDNWRWQGVPFYLRTGKRLARRASEVCIQFRPVPHQAFPASALERWCANRLVVHIQPREGIRLQFLAKRPGAPLRLGPVEMAFRYRESFRRASPAAYETLLLDVMEGDQALFMRADQVEAAWAVIEPILQAWAVGPPDDFPNYPAGSSGPEAAHALLARDGHAWRRLPAQEG